MAIYEATINTRKRCHRCKHLQLDDEWSGVCTCKDNRVRNRRRDVLDRACSFKEPPPVKNPGAADGRPSAHIQNTHGLRA